MEETTIIDKPEKDPAEAVKEPVEGKKKTGLGLILIILFLVVLFPLGVIGYLFVNGQLPFSGGTNVTVDETVVEEEEDTSIGSVTEGDVTWVDWEGDYLSVRLPSKWHIKENKLVGEYADEREKNFVDAGYKGLMGFYVEDMAGQLIARVSYLEGPFCDSPCPTDCTILKFDITTELDMQEYEEGLSGFQGVEGCCSEAAYIFVKDYLEVNFLGNKLRRILDIGSDYRYGYIGNQNLESKDCFSDGVPIDGFGFGSYILDANEEVLSFDQMYILDQVLESMEIVEGESVGDEESVIVEEEGTENVEVVCDGNSTCDLTGDNNGESLEIECGDKIIVTIWSRGDGGYVFEDPIFDTNTLELVSHNHILGPKNHSDDFVEDFGKDVWEFNSFSGGSSEISIDISLPWDEDSRERVYNVSIDIK